MKKNEKYNIILNSICCEKICVILSTSTSMKKSIICWKSKGFYRLFVDIKTARSMWILFVASRYIIERRRRLNEARLLDWLYDLWHRKVTELNPLHPADYIWSHYFSSFGSITVTDKTTSVHAKLLQMSDGRATSRVV